MAGGKIRVQEHVKLSGKKYLSQRGFHTIAVAYHEMVARARRAKLDHNKYDAATDSITNDATYEQDHNTYIRVICGRSVRTFTLVHASDRTPIPFGHLFTSVMHRIEEVK